MLELQWVKSLDFKWLDFSRLDLHQVRGEGVFVIWHGGDTPKVVRVGQGVFSEKFSQLRQSPRLMLYGTKGKLLVTWAEIGSGEARDGIESYLTQVFAPLVSDRLSSVNLVPVRSPFG